MYYIFNLFEFVMFKVKTKIMYKNILYYFNFDTLPTVVKYTVTCHLQK